MKDYILSKHVFSHSFVSQPRNQSGDFIDNFIFEVEWFEFLRFCSSFFDSRVHVVFLRLGSQLRSVIYLFMCKFCCKFCMLNNPKEFYAN